ncbi:MAG: ATP-binding protein [Candidatus Promineifilaceae bacterium]|jgi:anti-sigma regulatory factor (Ser/Thr protein kinase)
MEFLNLPGHLSSLSTIRDYVKSVAADAGLNKKQAYRLSLAVDEIATNIIVHGYEEGGLEGEIDIGSSVTDNELAVVIEDTAGPYEPQKIDTPSESDLTAPLIERDIGGLGVFLAIQYVDEFRYMRVEDRNRHTFIMRVNSSNTAEN